VFAFDLEPQTYSEAKVMPKRFTWLFSLLLLVTPPALAGPLEDALSAQLRLAASDAATEEGTRTITVLEGFYRSRQMAPLWVTEAGARAPAKELSQLLSAADQDALDPDDYGTAAIDALLGATRPDFLADLEVRLSLGLMDFAADLGQGRITPHISDPKLFVFREDIDKAEVIAAAAQTDDLAAFVHGYRPQTPRYDRLKTALAHYRALAADGGWEPIPEGPTLKPEMTNERVALLRARLKLWGDLADADDRALTGGDPGLYDEAMVDAVKRMQYRLGLDTDGAIGPKTLAAINLPVEVRIEQMILNLERRRWMPDDLGERYVFVNLADFELKVVDREKTIWDTRVVVGKPYHKTPVFSHKMSYLELNPYWNVPPSIARQELLGKIQKDPNYLRDNNFTLFSDWSSKASVVDPASVNWGRMTRASFPYKIRQGSGDGNALGRVKFMFPNRFNVYLHDTPSKSLFSRAERSFSHGCIRVQDPLTFAEIVLAGTEGWSRAQIDSTVETSKRTVVSLAEPLPVHISYLTAWVNKDGSVNFRKDIYGRDAQLAEALIGPRAVPLIR
jgi:murein L,D-transpeptidase YcbB/YkuD